MTTYQLINPPFLISEKTTKKEAKEYYRWFLSVLSERVQTLETYVRNSHKKSFPDWKADFSPASFADLGEWFAYHASKMEVPKKYLEMAHQNTPFLRDVEIENWTLSELTISLSMDIGIYYGQALRSYVDDLYWDIHPSRSKYFIDYHQPVLIHKTKRLEHLQTFNPIRAVEGYTFRLVSNDCAPQELGEMFQDSLKAHS